MTIFLAVLKKLIKQQLGKLTSNLEAQSHSYLYRHDLSLAQQKIINELDTEIILFQGTGKDEHDAMTLNTIIETCRTKVLETRSDYKASGDEGKTVRSLGNIIFHTNALLKKLRELKVTLLNQSFLETPENIVYFHAAYYLGEEIFNPTKIANPEIRQKKEEALFDRLKTLSELIKPDYNIEQRRERTLKLLADILSDNVAITRLESTSSIPLPGINFFGMQFTSPGEWLGPGLGRFKEQFDLALKEVKAIPSKSLVNSGSPPAPLPPSPAATVVASTTKSIFVPIAPPMVSPVSRPRNPSLSVSDSEEDASPSPRI